MIRLICENVCSTAIYRAVRGCEQDMFKQSDLERKRTLWLATQKTSFSEYHCSKCKQYILKPFSLCKYDAGLNKEVLIMSYNKRISSFSNQRQNCRFSEKIVVTRKRATYLKVSSGLTLLWASLSSLLCPRIGFRHVDPSSVSLCPLRIHGPQKLFQDYSRLLINKPRCFGA